MSDDRDTPTRWTDRDWMRFCDGAPEPVGGGPIPPTDGGESIRPLPLDPYPRVDGGLGEESDRLRPRDLLGPLSDPGV